MLEGPPVGDGELRSELQDAALDYIGEHPLSVLEAFYWNGLSRFWDVRRPAYAVDEAAPEGRSEAARDRRDRDVLRDLESPRWSGSGACGADGRW